MHPEEWFGLPALDRDGVVAVILFVLPMALFGLYLTWDLTRKFFAIREHQSLQQFNAQRLRDLEGMIEQWGLGASTTKIPDNKPPKRIKNLPPNSEDGETEWQTMLKECDKEITLKKGTKQSVHPLKYLFKKAYRSLSSKSINTESYDVGQYYSLILSCPNEMLDGLSNILDTCIALRTLPPPCIDASSVEGPLLRRVLELHAGSPVKWRT